MWATGLFCFFPPIFENTHVENASRPVSCLGYDSKSNLFKTFGVPWCLMSSKKLFDVVNIIPDWYCLNVR